MLIPADGRFTTHKSHSEFGQTNGCFLRFGSLPAWRWDQGGEAGETAQLSTGEGISVRVG